MLKHRLMGKRNRKITARFRLRHKQDALSPLHHQHPFADRFVVCRINPIYVDDCYHSSAAGLPTFLSPSNDDFQLHVQTWCSIVCPRHLSTCCVCKPVYTYCDRCGTNDFAIDSLKKDSNCHQSQRNRPHSLLTRSLCKEPLPLPPLPPKKLTMDGTLAVDAGHETHHYHAIGSIREGVFSSSLGVADTQDVPKEEQSMRNGRKKRTPPHIYMNSEFVSGITVLSKSEQFHSNRKIAEQLQEQSKPGTSGEGLRRVETPRSASTEVVELRGSSLKREPSPSKDLAVINLEQGPQEYVEEMDSLESLKIDEGLFQMSSDGNVTRNETNSSTNVAKLSLVGLFPTTTTDVQLPADEMAYEAVKDLYEKLSNNRHRKVLTQAVNSTQRSHSGSVQSYVHATYETLTKHTRKSYAKLFDEEARRTSVQPTTYYDNILLRSADQVTTKSYANQNGDNFSLAGTRRPSEQLRNEGHAVSVSDNFPDVIYETPISSDEVLSQIETNLASQFHLPKSLNGELSQLRAKNGGTVGREGFLKKLEKRFESRAFRDACKIIATTLLGLTAFGIITALSLSVK